MSRFPLVLAAATACAAVLLVAAPASAQVFPPDDDLRRILRYVVEDRATPGIVFGVLEPDGATRILAEGTGGPGARPLGPRSVFEIGSITKTFTGTVLALMVARGEVSLEDPLSMYLPDSVRVPSYDGREITLLDLATHRSGLPSVPTNFSPGDLANPYGDYAIADLYAFLSGYELERAPGEEAAYSNLGFGLLGHALARVAGVPYRQLVRDRILEPLGMTSTGYAADGRGKAWLTRGHDDGRVVPLWSVTEAFAGAGGLRSSMADMLTYLEANVGPPETALERAMREAHRVRAAYDDDEEIGLGWRTEVHDGRTIVQHGGASAGSTARIAFDPARQTGFVRLTNTGSFGGIGLGFLREGPPLDMPVVDVERSALAELVGRYRLGADSHFFVRLEDDGSLTIQPGERAVRSRLFPTSDSTFYSRLLPRRITFTRDADGAIEALVMAGPGDAEAALPRVGPDTPPPGIPQAPSVRDVGLDEDAMRVYEGNYTVRAPGRTLGVRVFRVDGELRAQLVGGGVSELLYQGDDEFAVAREPGTRLVFELDGDRATGLTLHTGGRTLRGRRGAVVREEEAEAEAGPDTSADGVVEDLLVTAEDIARYEGTYPLAVGGRTLEMRIFGEDGRLMSQAANQPVVPLRYQGGHVFVPDFDHSVRLVFTVEGDRATALTLHQGGRTFSGERQP